jgi:hypothetical protein
MTTGVRSGTGLTGLIGFNCWTEDSSRQLYCQPTKMEQMTEQMMEHLLAKIAAMQEKVVSHHEKINASQ